jgi:hypothetical protein
VIRRSRDMKESRITTKQEWMPIMTGQHPDGTVDAAAGVDVVTLIREPNSPRP